jgi:hypothetical protein
MKRSLILVGAFVGLVVGCESTRFAPPVVTSKMATAGKGSQVNVATLEEGRQLFVHRCIECHTLPVVQRYDAVAWPWLINDMSARANLRPAEREALVAYILAVRAQVE